MQINCLHCGHRFDLGKAYDDYEGPVRCSTCRGLLDIRTNDGQVRAVRPFSMPLAAAQPQVSAPAQQADRGPIPINTLPAADAPPSRAAA